MVLKNFSKWVLWISFGRKIRDLSEPTPGGPTSIMHEPITLVGELIISWHLKVLLLESWKQLFTLISWGQIIVRWESLSNNMLKFCTFNVQRNHSGEAQKSVEKLATEPQMALCLQEVSRGM